MRDYNFLVCGPKFTNFSSNRGWNAVDQVLFRFSICWSVPEIFAIKVESCHKSHWILDVFTLPNFAGGTPCKISVRVITPAMSHIRKIMPTNPKVIGAHMWNFKPNFKCSPLIFGGGRPGLLCALASVGQCIARVKIWGAIAPWGRNVVFRKKSSRVGQHARL